MPYESVREFRAETYIDGLLCMKVLQYRRMKMRQYKRLSVWLAAVLVCSFAAGFRPLIAMSIIGLLLCQFADKRKIQPTRVVLLFGASWLLVVGSVVASSYRRHILFLDPEGYVSYVVVTSIVAYCSWALAAWMTVRLCLDWWRERARSRGCQDSSD